jgi:hypothetical protein
MSKPSKPNPLVRLLVNHVRAYIDESTLEIRSKYRLKDFVTHCSLQDQPKAWNWRTREKGTVGKAVRILYCELPKDIRESFLDDANTSLAALTHYMTAEEKQAYTAALSVEGRSELQISQQAQAQREAVSSMMERKAWLEK